jgi:hypothetical protein
MRLAVGAGVQPCHRGPKAKPPTDVAGRWPRYATATPARVDQLNGAQFALAMGCTYLLHGSSFTTPASEFAQEPHLREPPISLDGVVRYMQHVCGFFHAEPTEEPQLDHLCLAHIHGSQRI